MATSRMLRVYVFGPISAKNAHDVLRNVGQGIEVGARLFFLGTSPFVPHLNYHFSFMEKRDNETFYEADNVWLDVSDVLVGCPGWEKSKGSLAEIKRAESLGIPVYKTVSKFIAALRSNKIKPRELVEKREG